VQQTTVRGTVPDLVGRWLVLAEIRTPGGAARVIPLFWEVTRGDDGQLDVNTRFVQLPPALQKTVETENEANRGWTPSPGDLDEIGASWETLPAMDAHVARVETIVSGRDGFDDSIAKDARSRDALWVVTQAQTFDAKAAPTIRQVLAYVVREEVEGGYAGNFSTAIIAAAPFPIPITFEGPFRFYRLAGASRGLLGRVLDLFAGCGRR
jgi:hypothetical protein